MDGLSWALGIVFGILVLMILLCRMRHSRGGCVCGERCRCGTSYGCGEGRDEDTCGCDECHDKGRIDGDTDDGNACDRNVRDEISSGEEPRSTVSYDVSENPVDVVTVRSSGRYPDAIAAVDAVTASDMMGKLYCTNRSCHTVSRHADTRPNPIQERRVKRLHALGDIDPNEVDPDGWELLQIAAYRGDTVAIDELTEEFLDDEALSQQLEATLDDGMTSLCLAIESGYTSAALRLLELGSHANVVTVDGWTPLHLAAAAGMHRVATALYDAGANPKAQTESGLTPLHLAVMVGDDAMVRLLCDMAPDGMNIVEHDRLVTPLHLAVENRHLEVVKTLISDGADVDVRNAESLTPLAVATAKNYTEIENVLKAYAA